MSIILSEIFVLLVFTVSVDVCIYAFWPQIYISNQLWNLHGFIWGTMYYTALKVNEYTIAVAS